MVMAVADAIIMRGQSLPRQFVALNLSIDQSRKVDAKQGEALGECWLCGCAATRASLDNIADLQIGSWPPGDPRRWQLGGSCVIPVIVCQGYGKPGSDTADADASPASRPGRLSLAADALEMRSRLYRKSSHRLPCKVGDFPTISSVFWDGVWRTLDETMTLCTGKILQDAVIPCPQVEQILLS